MLTTGFIYKITNTVNGKIYIGITCRSVEQRVREHFSNGMELLAKDAKLFGENAFMVETLNDNIPDEFLEQLEDFYIRHFNSLVPNGYNVRTTSNESKEQTEYRKRRQMEGIANYKAKHNGKGAGRPRISDEKREAVVKLYKGGMASQDDIASTLGISRSSVHNILKAQGLR